MSDAFQDTEGLKLIVLIDDLMAWNRPTHPESYSVSQATILCMLQPPTDNVDTAVG